MKQINHCILLLVALLFFSCDKDSLPDIPLEKSFDDPAEVLVSYKTMMLESEFGWEVSLASKKQDFHAGYIDFSTETEALFTIDDRALANQSPATTHVAFKVSGANAGLAFSSGAYTDFALDIPGIDTSFTFQAVRRDSIFLLGDTSGTQLILTKATAKKQEAYAGSGVLSVQQSLANIEKLPKYFKSVYVNGAGYDLHFDLPNRMLYIHYGGTERFKIHETLFAPTATGIMLQKPLTDGVTRISYMDDFQVDEFGDELFCTVNNMSANLANNYVPTAYDPRAAQYFYEHPFYTNFNTGDRYSVSVRGFTVAGVPDAYGLTTLPDYSFMVFFHEIQEGFGAIMYQFADGGSPFGAIVFRQLSPSGMMRFLYIEGLDEDPPAEYADIITNTENAFTSEDGFFVIKSGSATYDLVSGNVEDGQKWIRFE